MKLGPRRLRIGTARVAFHGARFEILRTPPVLVHSRDFASKDPFPRTVWLQDDGCSWSCKILSLRSLSAKNLLNIKKNPQD